MGINYLGFCSSGNSSVFLSHLKNDCLTVFLADSFLYFILLFHSLLAYRISAGKSADSLMGIPL